jgi:hypothetical protein
MQRLKIADLPLFLLRTILVKFYHAAGLWNTFGSISKKAIRMQMLLWILDLD